MAIPHYRYLVLKMPTEKGVLTLKGNVYAAYTCEDDSFKIAEAHDLSIRMAKTMLDSKKTPPRDPRARGPTQEHQVQRAQSDPAGRR